MHAGRIIKLLRTAENIRQDVLADDLGVSRAYLSQVENGREPGLAFLKTVSKRLAVPLPLLVVDEECVDPELSEELKLLVQKLLASKITLWSSNLEKD